VERFSTLVRVSGSEDKRQAARYIVGRLDHFGVAHQVYEPELLLSVPLSSSVEADGQRIGAKSPAFSASSGPERMADVGVYATRSRFGGMGHE